MNLLLANALLAVLGAPARPTGPAADFQALLSESWQFRLREDPLLATEVGDPRYNDRLPSVAPADHERRDAFARGALERLAKIPRGALVDTDRVSYDMFARELLDERADAAFQTWRMPLNAEGGFHSAFARLPFGVPLATTRDYENYIARLRGFPAYARQQTENLRQGLRDGFTQPRVILRGFEGTITPHIVSDPEKSVFWSPFASFPASVPEPDRPRLRSEGRAAIQNAVIPAYEAFLGFMTKEYIPGARATSAASASPRAATTIRGGSGTSRPSTSRRRRCTSSGGGRWTGSTPECWTSSRPWGGRRASRSSSRSCARIRASTRRRPRSS